MKGAAKCDKHCELQNSENQQELERILCFRDTPESASTSVSISFPTHVLLARMCSGSFVRQIISIERLTCDFGG